MTECAAFMLRENDRFWEEVDEGIAAADRGEFLSEEEMDAFVDDIGFRLSYSACIVCNLLFILLSTVEP